MAAINKATLNIYNVYGFGKYELDLPTGATLITGVNAVGKTNIARIIAALATFDANPQRFDNTWKKWYLKRNAQAGWAMLGDIKWEPSTGKIESKAGSAAMAHKHSVGLIDFVSGSRSAKERTAVWEGLIMPDSPRELIEPDWPLASKEKMEAVIKKIEESSWQDAYAVYEDRRKQAKQRWSKITGAGTYGVKKASNWTPAYWDPELDSASEESLQADLVNARDDLTELTSQSAVSIAQITEAQHVRDVLMPEAREKLNSQQQKVSEVENNLRNKMIERNKVQDWLDKARGLISDNERVINAKPSMHCPECGTGLDFKGDGVLGKWTAPSQDKLSQAITDLDRLKAAYETGLGKVKNLESEHDEISKLLDEAKGAAHETRGRLRQLESQAKDADATPAHEVSYEARNSAENAVAECQKKLDSFMAMRNATAANNMVLELDQVVELLGPSGVRTKHLQKVIDGLRENLNAMTEIAGWGDVALSDDYMITCNDIPIVMCAESEKLKAQWLMQMLSAAYSKDKLIVLDQADTLVGDWWQGLIKLVNHLCENNKDLRVVICGSNLQVADWNTVVLR